MSSKLIIVLFALLVGVFAASDDSIDMTKVIPRQQVPGFWKDRDVGFIGDFHHKYDRRERIVGGAETDANAHPYQVGLFFSVHWWTAFCGGCLISKNLVLTAAHCPQDSSGVRVVLGAHAVFDATESTQVRFAIEPKHYIVHPDYNARMLFNDLALLILPSPAPFNDQIRPIALPYYELLKFDFAGEIATVSGWGRTADTNQGISEVLKYTQNEIKRNQECFDIFGEFVIDSTLCTITRNTQSGICNGDSGGPLTLVLNGRLTLVGVVSYGALAGCELGYPTGFARVTSFMPWISTYIDIYG